MSFVYGSKEFPQTCLDGALCIFGELDNQTVCFHDWKNWKKKEEKTEEGQLCLSFYMVPLLTKCINSINKPTLKNNTILFRFVYMWQTLPPL